MFLSESHRLNSSFVIFVLAKKLRSPSSMDRIKDSGSFDMGSNPVGITRLCIYLQGLFSFASFAKLFHYNPKQPGTKQGTEHIC